MRKVQFRQVGGFTDTCEDTLCSAPSQSRITKKDSGQLANLGEPWETGTLYIRQGISAPIVPNPSSERFTHSAEDFPQARNPQKSQ